MATMISRVSSPSRLSRTFVSRRLQPPAVFTVSRSPVITRFPRSLVVRPITKAVVSRKPSCQIKMNIDPKSALSAVVLVGTLVFVAVWKAIEIYSAVKSGSDAIETFSKFGYRFVKYRLAGYSVTKSLMSALFEKDLKTDELIVPLSAEIQDLKLQTQIVLEEVQKQNLQDQNVMEEFQKLSLQDQNVLEEFQKLNLQNENILVEVQSIKLLLQEAVASHKCKGKSGDCDYSMDSTEV